MTTTYNYSDDMYIIQQGVRGGGHQDYVSSWNVRWEKKTTHLEIHYITLNLEFKNERAPSSYNIVIIYWLRNELMNQYHCDV